MDRWNFGRAAERWLLNSIYAISRVSGQQMIGICLISRGNIMSDLNSVI